MAVSTPSSNEVRCDFFKCEVEEQQGARVEVQLPRRKAVMRVESEETQRYVRKRFAHEDFSQKEVEEIGFVPSALSEPRGAIHWCDNRCSEKGFRFNQIAAMVTEEGGGVMEKFWK